MGKKSLMIFYLSFICLFNVKGQLDSIELPKINPIDPTVAAFARYGDIPVDYSTGVPNISIPLFDIKSRKFNIPVSVSYHAAGIKVQDIAPPVGLGWNLNVGAFVICSYTHQDGWPSTPKPPFTTKADLQYYIDTSSGADQAFDMEQYKGDYYDLESDRYYFNLGNGKSGVFYYDYLTDTLRMAQYSPVKIEKIFDDDELSGFKITDTDGSIYLLDTFFSPVATGSFSYFVSKIISSDLTDTIAFSYEEGEPSWLNPVSKVQEFGHWIQLEDPPRLECPVPEEFTPNWTITSSSQGQVPAFSLNITNISSTLADYTFTYANDREDINKTRLISIEVKDKITNEQKKKIVFEHSYFGTSAAQNQRLKLEKIKFFGGMDTTHSQDYSFKYNSRALPRYHTLTYQHYSEDYWGYYNGKTGDGLIPSAILPSDKRDDGYSFFREPDHDSASACMLEEIYYPTGGKTKFLFEPNETSENIYEYENDMATYSSKKVGGFRIKQIIDYSDSNTIASKKTYDYNGGGFARHITKEMFWHPQRYFFWLKNPDGCYGWWSYERYRDQYFGIPLSPLTIGSSLPVIYLEVTEYNGDSLDNTGKTVYSYGLPKSYYDAPVILPRPLSSQEYNFLDRGIETPPLIGKEVFKQTDTGYQRIYVLTNSYTTFKTATFHTGLVVEFPSTYVPTNTSYIDLIASDDGGADGKYWVEDRKVAQDVDLLTATAESIDGILKTTAFSYDTTTLQPVEQWTIDSKGDTLKSKFKYPGDFAGTMVYDTMVARNIISPTIEKLSYRNSDFLRSAKTNYNFWGGIDWDSSATNQILQQSIDTKTLNATSYETRLKYHSYDAKSNVLSVSKEKDSKISYIWDYNQYYPIAQVNNATVNEIAYTSFEADSKGGWIFSGSVSTDVSSPTGTKCYNVSGGDITRSGLTSHTYIVSYWGNSGSVTVNSAGPTQTGKTIGDWTYYEHEVTGTSITISGSKYIDELRLYPKDATMTTYTYTPLVGMKSQCDANSQITYYEYDDLGRLMLIRDQDKNVIKKICYNYAGQPGSCNVFYNVEKSDDFTRNDCGSSAYGSTVTYAVPAGAYSSSISQADADQKAQDDVDANGQTYANANGTCTVLGGCTGCKGFDRKCIDNICEFGFKVYTDTYYDAGTNQTVCVYHYEFSNGTWSSDLYEYHAGHGTFCII